MWNVASIACAEEIRARERLLRERIRRADGTPHPVWPPETDIPDPSAFYGACFAVPHGDRAFLHFRDDSAVVVTTTTRERRLAPLLFVYNRQNNLGRIEPTRVMAAVAGAATDPTAYSPGPLWSQSDTVITGVLVKTSSTTTTTTAAAAEEAAVGGGGAQQQRHRRLLVVDDVLVFQGVPCDTGSLAERVRQLQRAILAARALPNRAIQIVPMSHRIAPLGVDAAAQWLPDAVWTPEGYVARCFQLRDVTMSARPHLNLRARDWAATWTAPVVVAGSGVAPVANSGAHLDAETAARADAAAATAARLFAPMDLDPDGMLVGQQRRRRCYAHPDDALAFDEATQEQHALTDLLQTQCPVYRGPAVFAVQADPTIPDIYRLFCLRDQKQHGNNSTKAAAAAATADRLQLSDAIARHNNSNNSSSGSEVFPSQLLQFYQLALVPSCGHSARMNAWFGFVPQQEQPEWALAGMPRAARVLAEAQTPLAMRNTDGRRILLFECDYDAGRHRWIPRKHVPYTTGAYRVVKASSLVARQEQQRGGSGGGGGMRKRSSY